MKARCPEKGTLTIADVNQCLDGVAHGNASKAKPEIRKNMFKLIKNMTALEQKWLVRMLIKEMKMGLSQQSVFSVFHQDAEDLFNVKMDLETVSYTLQSKLKV